MAKIPCEYEEETKFINISVKWFVRSLIFYRKGNLVIFHYTGDITGATTNIPAGAISIAPAGTIPEKYRPASSQTIYTISPTDGVSITLSTDGSISGYNYTGGVITNTRSNRFQDLPYFTSATAES